MPQLEKFSGFATDYNIWSNLLQWHSQKVGSVESFNVSVLQQARPTRGGSIRRCPFFIALRTLEQCSLFLSNLTSKIK